MYLLPRTREDPRFPRSTHGHAIPHEHESRRRAPLRPGCRNGGEVRRARGRNRRSAPGASRDVRGATPSSASEPRGSGRSRPDLAMGLGTTGPTLRGSGVGYDVRKAAPYDAYPGAGVRRRHALRRRRPGALRSAHGRNRDLARAGPPDHGRPPPGPVFARKPIKNPKATKLPQGRGLRRRGIAAR
jgi:hypothetical protein